MSSPCQVTDLGAINPLAVNANNVVAGVPSPLPSGGSEPLIYWMNGALHTPPLPSGYTNAVPNGIDNFYAIAGTLQSASTSGVVSVGYVYSFHTPTGFTLLTANSTPSTANDIMMDNQNHQLVVGSWPPLSTCAKCFRSSYISEKYEVTPHGCLVLQLEI